VRQTFSEHLPGLTTRSARRTLRLTARLRQIGLALGGQAGALLAQQQGLPTSPDTLLRLIRAGVTTPTRAPRVLGIDDWAFKKGHTYGTILVDLEARQPVDLLPDRTADSVATWLRDHPGVEIVCRDRAPAYANGVTRGAPQAIQVADRFHLLQNMREALQRLCEQQQAALRAASVPSPSPNTAPPVLAGPSTEADGSVAARTVESAAPTVLAREHAPTVTADRVSIPPDSRPPTKQAQHRQTRRAARVARYEEVHALHAQGVGIRAIARQLGLSRPTVRTFLAADVFPEQATRGATTSGLDPYKPYLQQQVAAGMQNARQLWEAIRAQGYPGSASRVRQYVATLRVGRTGGGTRVSQPTRPAETSTTPPPAPPRRLSARQASWLLVRPTDQRTAAQHTQVERLLQASPDLATVHTLAQDFGTLIRKRQREKLDDWLQRALESGIADIARFARGLQQTYAEVAAALELPWSSGQVEGQINRLKTIKRQMYGRAGFTLLRAMVLAPG
jgi:transposase